MLIKVALKLNCTFISNIRNGSCHLQNYVFDIFDYQFWKIAVDVWNIQKYY
jgi:hypothetical protein